MRFSLLFIVVHCFLMGLCIDGPCWSGGPLGLVGLLVWWALGLVGPWVWWTRGSGGPVGLVGPWVWWARGSGGHVYLVGPWVWWARGSTLRGLTCQGVLGLVHKVLTLQN